jgi:chromosome segregation ATPase
VSIGQRTKQCEDEMKSLKPKIKSSKINIERFSQTAKQLRREQEERDAKGMQDERAEKGCEWCVLPLPVAL